MTCVAEVDLSNIVDKIRLTGEKEPLQASVANFSYKQVSKYPPVVRDLAFIVDESATSEDIRISILNSVENVLLVELFDEFASDKFGAGKKNLAYHIYLQDLTKALTDQDAEVMITNIIDTVCNQFKAELRK
jgi:phenylalanyl-tRNA synthetase beta chain